MEIPTNQCTYFSIYINSNSSSKHMFNVYKTVLVTFTTTSFFLPIQTLILMYISAIIFIFVYMSVTVVSSSIKTINNTIVNNTYLLILVISIIIYIKVISLYEIDVLLENNYYLGNINISGLLNSLYFDKISLVFSTTTIIISTFTNIYIKDYMFLDKNRNRFTLLLNYFSLSMIVLVHSTNIVSVILCWEFLGVTSFFLIGYYSERPYTIKSAIKAFLFNRLSDLTLFIFLILHVKNFNSVYIAEGPYNIKIEFYFLVIAAFFKSAQGFFYFWLPDSMEAPVPASALIHSATLVAAGIYLSLRNINSINSIYALNLLTYTVGILSAVIFSYIASLQTDVKKLLAYSTIANCGFMYFLISNGMVNLTLIYFTLHGLFKSFAFLSIGILIHKLNHLQDARQWGSNANYIKTVIRLYIVILLYLCASNVSSVYEIKHLYILGYFNSNYSYVVTQIMILIYTVNSLGYGLRLIYILLRNKQTFFKNSLNVNTGYNFLKIVSGYFWVTSVIITSIHINIIYCSDNFLSITPVNIFNTFLYKNILIIYFTISLFLYTKRKLIFGLPILFIFRAIIN